MKRQSSSSTCSRKQTSIGCMSVLSNLLSKHRNRSKFLTSGKKQENEAAPSLKEAHEQKLRGGTQFPRRPTLPAEIRQPTSVEAPPQHLLVARLMGVENFPVSPESSADRRRKLLGALEKCDEDLKALQRIIEVVKTSVCVEDNNQRPTLQQLKQQLKKKPGEEDITAACFLHRFTKENARSNRKNAVSPTSWRSMAMVHSVDEGCSDIAWGERREIGRIGLALQDHICRDLIDEIVREMGFRSTYSLPFEACKKRLSF